MASLWKEDFNDDDGPFVPFNFEWQMDVDLGEDYNGPPFWWEVQHRDQNWFDLLEQQNGREIHGPHVQETRKYELFKCSLGNMQMLYGKKFLIWHKK